MFSTPTYTTSMHLIPPSLHLLLLFFFSFSAVITASSQPDVAEAFLNCNQTFNCGDIRNVSYPFAGGDRPSYCGLPGFELICNADSPELTIETIGYRVLQLDQVQRTLILARLDLWNNTCADEFMNTTLDSSSFSLGPANADLTLFYGCSALNMTPGNLFHCNISGISNDAYYLMGAVPSDPILNVIKCHVNVRVPILSSSAEWLADNRSLLPEALMKGFNVNYSIPYSDKCSECFDSGGECGFDHQFSQPICICGDKKCLPTEKRSKNLPLKIGIVVGSAAIASLLLVCIFYVMQRRKKRAAVQSKDVSLPPSSKGITTPFTKLSQSTTSYPSSKSDLENGSTYFGVQLFTYTELEEATNNFDPSKELGDGGFGTVYYGKLPDGRVVAVKRLYENNLKRAEQFKNELDILTRLQHTNLVKLYGCTSRRSRELLLVYEYIPNGTVADHLHGNRANSGFLNWPMRLRIAVETADALSYLHKSDIIHRDVKTNNILLDNDFRVKVADFGLSRLFPTDVTHVSTAPQGTPGYVDPEYYQCYQLTNKSDVFSFGVVLVELISSLQAVDTNRHRHDINLSTMAVNKIQNHTLHELVDPSLGFEKNYAVRSTITSVAELAFRCLQQDSELRPSMDEVVEVLREIEKDELGTRKAEVVDLELGTDDIGLLENMPPLFSPDSIVTDKGMKMLNRTM